MRLRVFLLSVFFLTITYAHASAAPKAVTYQGISLSPAIVNLGVDQNLPATSFQITISNNLSQPVSLQLSTLDFKSLNDTGGVAFIQGTGKYGLANWLKLPDGPLQLKPKSSQSVTISVDNRQDLAPGGHYAAVLFKNSPGAGSGVTKVAVNQVVATLVFLKKSGGEIYSLHVGKPHLGIAWLNLPTSLDLPVTNTGNTQTSPRGTIIITDPRGTEIKRGIINADSGLVLPESKRLYKTPLNVSSHPWLPGTYTITISSQPADSTVATTVSYSFFYLSLPSLIALLFLVVPLIYLLRFKKIRK